MQSSVKGLGANTVGREGGRKLGGTRRVQAMRDEREVSIFDGSVLLEGGRGLHIRLEDCVCTLKARRSVAGPLSFPVSKVSMSVFSTLMPPVPARSLAPCNGKHNLAFLHDEREKSVHRYLVV